MHVEAMPDGKENPYGNGFVGVETLLTNEGSACRVADASKGTYWKINNPASRHASTGNTRSSHLSDTLLSLVLPESQVHSAKAISRIYSTDSEQTITAWSQTGQGIVSR